jgi:plasmid maintenance system antidote protein VapI
MRANLLKAIVDKGWTRAYTARLIHITPQSLGALILDRSDGRVKTWDKLEAVLGVDQKTLRQIESSEGLNDILSSWNHSHGTHRLNIKNHVD